MSRLTTRFWRIFSVFVLAVLLLAGATVPFAFTAAIEPLNGGPATAGPSIDPAADYFRGPLKIITLNTAHGRKTAFHQVFLSREKLQENLADIGRVLKKAAPDIVALQEADGPSWWSGNFDHVALLAGKAGYPWHGLAPYMDKWGLKYGAAILARRPCLEARAHRFEKSWPMPAKGFLLGRFGWYPGGKATGKPVFVDVISVHLAFSRQSVRAQQIAEMQKALAERKNALIMMGDFNSRWPADDSVVRKLARQSGLQVYRPKATDLATFGDSRIDWILISADLEFISYKVLPDALSDHRGVVAEVGMKP